MTDKTQPEALRLALSIDLMDTFTDYQQEELNKAAAELRHQHARIAELEAELEAVGAGGVQALSAAPAVAAPAAPTPEHIAAMERAWLWMDNQADQQSKGGHATFDLMMLREERDALRAAIDAALKAAPGEPAAIKMVGYGGCTGINDYLMSDGTIKTMRPHEVVWREAPQQEAQEPTADVQAKIGSNTWDHFGEILPTLKAISRGYWYWGANSRCKYIEIRIDTRDGGCILYDSKRVRISPQQFAHQSHDLGKMDPWPAKNALGDPAPQPAPAPLSRARVKEIMRENGYDGASAQHRADFINGVRHAEIAHGISAALAAQGGAA